jgi:hypothetical protein
MSLLIHFGRHLPCVWHFACGLDDRSLAASVEHARAKVRFERLT